MNPRRIAKFLTALVGAAAQVLALGLLDATAQSMVSVGIAVLTAVAVFMVPNEGVTGEGNAG
jgi:hypothetical protein